MPTPAHSPALLRSAPTADPMPASAARSMVGIALIFGSVLLLLSVAQLWWGVPGLQAVARARLTLALVTLAAGAVGAMLVWRGRFESAVLAIVALLIAGGVFHTWASGLGLYSLVLPGVALLVAFGGALLGPRTALGLGALYAAAIALLAWAESRGLVAGRHMAETVDVRGRVIGLALLGLAAGLIAYVMHRLLQALLHDARREQQRQAQLLRIGSDWVWEADTRGRLTYLSPSFETHTGYTVAEGLRTGQPGGPQPIDDANWHRMKAALRSRQAFRDLPVAYLQCDGRELHVRVNGEPLLDADGQFVGWWGMSRNVTAEVTAARDAQRARDLHDRFFAMSPQATCLVRLDNGEVLLCNPAYARLVGRSEAEIVGRTGRELGVWKRNEDDLALAAAIAAGGGTLRDWRADVIDAVGRELEVLISATTFERDGRPVAVLSVQDVTERRRVELELAGAKQQAEAASRAKSAFLATMSHEIRTPLNGVLGLARLLQEEGDEQRRREYLRHLMGAAEGLAGIVSDVLDLSKIEAGRVVIEDIAFDLHELVTSTFHTFAPLGRERGLAMGCEIAPGLPRRVHGDPVRVRQILSNYLTNALKFTERGAIRVTAVAAGAHAVRLAVSDSGIGIDAAARERLFLPFSQADSSTTRRFGGTGLGLSICRELAVLMGGRVGADSERGRGSTFWVELPLAAGPSPTQSATLAAEQAQALSGLTVLVAEDNPVNMLIVRTLLERLGAHVVEAEDGGRAVALASAAGARIDAVLMDLHMPVQDGLAAARALRAQPATAALPLFALSAAVLEQERSEARAAGMAEFLPKPVAEADLLRVLAPLVRR
ncbi:MAG TPA: ATP-binding protein [Burkholderiaceae bacterium]|nr:ATP-binding protein [Burkholderiaceae bacterium]